MRSLSLGFGAKRPHGKKNMPHDFYGEWEIGTYSAAWRFVQSDSRILCGSGEVVDDIGELDARLTTIAVGRFENISMSSALELRITLAGVALDFLGVSSDDDELFHVFGPDDLYVEYSIGTGWKIGKSNRPWKAP